VCGAEKTLEKKKGGFNGVDEEAERILEWDPFFFVTAIIPTFLIFL
jgi:hypothetical protein